MEILEYGGNCQTTWYKPSAPRRYDASHHTLKTWQIMVEILYYVIFYIYI